MPTSTSLSTKVAQRTAAPAVSNDDSTQTVRALLNSMAGDIKRALPRHMTLDRFARVVMSEVRNNPRLMEANPASMVSAVMLCAQLGLEPGPQGLVYLLPFRDNRRGTVEVQTIIGYRGLIALARRSGEVLSVVAREVMEGDQFEFEYGLDERITHRPALTGRGDQLVAVYAVVRYVNGAKDFVVLSREEVERRRGRSRSKDNGPWVTDYVAMARKTAVRALTAYLPSSPELASALVVDEATAPSKLGDAMADTVTIDVPADETAEPETPAAPEPDPTTGEVPLLPEDEAK